MTNQIWIINFILPLGIILYGYLYKNVASKRKSNFFGYKTERTHLSKDTWEYANKRVGKMWIKLGLIFTLVVLIMRFIFPSHMEKPSFIVIGMALIVSLIPFPIVEKELKEKFDDEGERID